MHKWDPVCYEMSSSAQYGWAMDLVSSLELEGDERVLDIGCGDGKVTARLASLVPDGAVVGIDLSGEMIAHARERHSRNHHPNLLFEVGDASKLDFLDEFDLVVSFACLHWIRDHLTVLAGIKRALKAGGVLLCQCGGRGNAEEILAVTEDLTRSDKWSRYFQSFASPYHFYGPEEYRVWVAEACLSVRRVELVPKDMVHIGRDGLMGFLSATWLPYTDKLPHDFRSDFIADVANSYLELHPLDSDGCSHVKMVRLQVEAERPS
jgi:trans-aconitate 2-methyltransferase